MLFAAVRKARRRLFISVTELDDLVEASIAMHNATSHRESPTYAVNYREYHETPWKFSRSHAHGVGRQNVLSSVPMRKHVA